ncbi:DUF7097 family protein [Haloarcula sp. KBTZ06]|uniref:DUF7097 family protein n=1 Tax=Haloarcula sp. KBTZ06 TaxID=3402682 RepID=UPI003B4368D6
MEKAPGGTSVGVDDPYDHVQRCDFVTGEGKCRWAREHGHHDPEFANTRSADDFRCPAAIAPDDADADAEPEWDWVDCPHFRSRNHDRECVRCGLEERRMAHSEDRPLLEEHHLSYREGGNELSHEITVFLCRWCHAQIHQSWARLDDDANPDPEAIAQREQRRSKEQSELGFESAADRYDDS